MARRTRERARYQWVRESIPQTEVADTTGAEVLLRVTASEYEALGITDPTVVRIRANLKLNMDPATSQDGFAQRIGVGIIVLPSSVTPAEFGGPIGQPNEDWMYWMTQHLKSTASPASEEEGWGVGTWRVDIDVKAMRRLRGRHDLVMIAENAGDSVAHVFVGAAWSVLFQVG